MSLMRPLDGTPASSFGGSWNAQGTPVVYASTTKSLAILEIIRYFDDFKVPNVKKKFFSLPIFVPNFVRVDRIGFDELPKYWFKSDFAARRRFFQERRDKKDCAVYLIPSALVYGEYIAIVDVSHTQALSLVAGPAESVFTDSEPFLPRRIGTMDEFRQVFLCHASEDKLAIVNPLYRDFLRSGISCWLDSAEIKWGDSITQKVNHGLSTSSYVVVVITPSFMEKNWPKRELLAALNREASMGKAFVLPLLCGDDKFRSRVQSEFFLQSDKLYAVWTGDPSRISEMLLDRLSEA